MYMRSTNREQEVVLIGEIMVGILTLSASDNCGSLLLPESEHLLRSVHGRLSFRGQRIFLLSNMPSMHTRFLQPKFF